MKAARELLYKSWFYWLSYFLILAEYKSSLALLFFLHFLPHLGHYYIQYQVKHWLHIRLRDGGCYSTAGHPVSSTGTPPSTASMGAVRGGNVQAYFVRLLTDFRVSEYMVSICETLTYSWGRSCRRIGCTDQKWWTSPLQLHTMLGGGTTVDGWVFSSCHGAGV